MSDTPKSPENLTPGFIRASLLSLALVAACDGDDTADHDDEIETTGGDVATTGLDPSNGSAGGMDTAATSGNASSGASGHETTGGATDGGEDTSSTTNSTDTGMGGGLHGPCPAGFDNIGSESQPKCKVDPDIYSQVNGFPTPFIFGSKAFIVKKSEAPFLVEGTTDMGTEILMVSVGEDDFFIPVQTPVFDCESSEWDGGWGGKSPLFTLPTYDGWPYSVCFVSGNSESSSEKVCIEVAGSPS